jgi:GMP synthase (glutamine-hydrolysing)
MYEGKPSVFDAFTSHEDEVTHIPAASVILAGNQFTRIQAASVVHNGGTCWGVQYHPEYDIHELARLTFCRTEKLTKLGLFK